MMLALVGCARAPDPVGADARPQGFADARPATSDARAPDASPPPTPDAGPSDAGPLDAEPGDTGGVRVRVTLDGVPMPGTLVMQGGSSHTVLTSSDGVAMVTVDESVAGDEVWIVASHPEARISATDYREDQPQPLSIELSRYDPSDNERYTFTDPGEPARRDNTAQCSHCHQTIGDAWYGSPHRTTASNRHVQDVYAGTASVADAASCQALGGVWRTGLTPGTRQPGLRCYVGTGTLPQLNPECAAAGCDERATRFGACADCHAPGIDGQLGGRDLLQATGLAYDYGVHCDVCHRTDEVRVGMAAGVAGWLKLTRPTTPGSPALGANGFLPLTFGPSHDSPNPRMGSVQRDHFRAAEFCGGCHQHEQPALVPGQAIDRTRWPSGRLPIHTTYQEWKDGPLADVSPCQGCHMPPDPSVANGGDFQRFPLAQIGIQGGFLRAPGSVRRHAWVGPRSDDPRLLHMAAALFVTKQVTGNTVTASVTVRNIGCGHALPTGEPLRSVVLSVEARCGATTLESTGGDVVPDFGGAIAVKAAGEDWMTWPEAQRGDTIRVIRRTGDHHDYRGHGPFSDGTFSPQDKGMPVERRAGAAQVLTVTNGAVTLDAPLPTGDVAYLIRGDGAQQVPGQPLTLAGAPGFGFARVLVDADGNRMVPHHAAVDVASDNRLLPLDRWTSSHTFASSCPDPQVVARLYYRRFPHRLAAEKNWGGGAILMTETRR